MPQLLNPRQEALAQGLALGKTQLEAYMEAGFKGTSTAAATKAANRPDVIMRKAEIMQERHEAHRRALDQAIDEAAIDKGWIVKRAKYIADRAIRGTKPIRANGVITGWEPTGRDDGNAINALKLLAQMGGFLIEKVELGQPGDFARLSDKELRDELILVGESIGIDAKQIEKIIAEDVE